MRDFSRDHRCPLAQHRDGAKAGRPRRHRRGLRPSRHQARSRPGATRWRRSASTGPCRREGCRARTLRLLPRRHVPGRCGKAAGGRRRQPPRGGRGGRARRTLPRARGRRPAAIFPAGLGASKDIDAARALVEDGHRDAARLFPQGRHPARDRAAASDVCGGSCLREHASATPSTSATGSIRSARACSALRSTSTMCGGIRT